MCVLSNFKVPKKNTGVVKGYFFGARNSGYKKRLKIISKR